MEERCFFGFLLARHFVCCVICGGWGGIEERSKKVCMRVCFALQRSLGIGDSGGRVDCLRQLVQVFRIVAMANENASTIEDTTI